MTPRAAIALISRPGFIALALALLTLFIYLPARHHGFIAYDDPDYVSDNARVQNGLSAAGLRWAFTTGHASNWHPLTWLSHMLDAELFGPGPAGPHFVNALLHAANTALLFVVLLLLCGGATLWRCAWVAALFALHPLHVESVAWIAERKDVLSAFFFLLSLAAYARYAGPEAIGDRPWAIGHSASPSSPIAPSPSPLFRHPAYLLSLLFFALGLLAKPMLVTLPCATSPRCSKSSLSSR